MKLSIATCIVLLVAALMATAESNSLRATVRAKLLTFDCTPFENPVPPGTTIPRGSCWMDGGFQGIFQDDGNLVSYDSNGEVFWAANMEGHGGEYISVQTDGNVVMYTASGKAIWSTDTQTKKGAIPAGFAFWSGYFEAYNWDDASVVTWQGPSEANFLAIFGKVVKLIGAVVKIGTSIAKMV